jgi:hypothetical protein
MNAADPRGVSVKGMMLDQRTRTLTDAQVAARTAAMAIADPETRPTLDGRFVKKLEPSSHRPVAPVTYEVMRADNDIRD